MPDAPECKDIRETFKDFTDEWKDIREEGTEDMSYVMGDPWSPKDRRMREDAGRPIISLDELNQYLNQYNNSLRQNKRGIQVMPKGSGANDKDATNRENIIRGIENQSKAQQAYICAGENAAQRSYGYAVIRTEFDGETFDQKICIKRVADPNTILITPYFETADGSDIDEGFIIRRILRKEFAKKYDWAKKVSFTAEDQVLAPQWVGEKFLQVAEYWKRHKTCRKLLLLKDPELGHVVLWEDELDYKPEKSQVINERWVEIPKVMQYVTNGLEILEENKWAGSRIPICACFGKEIWLEEAGTNVRHLLSAVRLARDPQMLLNYLASQQAEEAGISPKTPFVGYAGMFDKAWDEWVVANKQPFAFLQVGIPSDWQPAWGAPPLPTRPQFTPNFQQFEIAKESAKRSIQAAMGLMPLPTGAQKEREKSGVAIERIEDLEAVGTWHFQDNYNNFIENVGWQVNELIKPIFDVKRDIPVTLADGKNKLLPVIGNTSHPMDEGGAYEVQDLSQEEQDNHLHTGKGEFDVTISTGPSYKSQREQASAFVDHLIANWQALAIPQDLALKILALGVKLKGIGPIGDEIQDLLNPPTDISQLPPAAQAAIGQLQSQLQALQVENAALHEDRASRALEQQTKIQLQQMKNDFGAMQTEVQNNIKVLIALVNAKFGSEQQEAQMYMEFVKQNHVSAHEAAMEHMKHSNAMQLAQHQTDAASQQQQTQIGADQASQQSEQDAEANSQQSEQAAEAASQQSSQATEAASQEKQQEFEGTQNELGRAAQAAESTAARAHTSTENARNRFAAAKAAIKKPKKV